MELGEKAEPARHAVDLRGWHLAFVVGILLVVAAVTLGVLAITGAVSPP